MPDMPASKSTRTGPLPKATIADQPVTANVDGGTVVRLFRDVSPRTRPAEMPPKRAEMTAQRIVRKIREDGLKPGDPLPIESEMYDALGVGRSTLREALRVLEQLGVITIRPGRGGGPAVASPNSRHLASTLALMMQFSETPFRDVLQTREQLEPIAAALCAQNRDRHVLEGLCQSVETMQSQLSDEQKFLEENHRFHELIAEGSHNHLITYFLNSLDWIVDGARLGVTYTNASRKYVATIHGEIYDAINDGDDERARVVMVRHMNDTRQYLENKYPKVLDRVLTWEMFGY